MRTITDDEVPAYVTSMQAGFHHVTKDGVAEWMRRHIDVDRTYACFDGADIVGTARSFETELTVPGPATLPVAAVTEVTVTATHRRQGLLTRMMELQRDEVVRRGLPAAILIAAEAPIYGRFGYGMATEDAVVDVKIPMVRWTVGTPAGSVARCTAAELAAEGPAVYERYRRAQPGALERSALWWDYLVNRPPGEEKREGDEFQVIRRDAAGVADGYARYRLKGDWRDRAPDGRVFVDELVSATDDAYVALWQHCTSVDWMRRVTAGGRPLVEPLPFMLADRRAAIQKNRGDFVWLRMIDPVACLRARCYRVEDRLVVQVVDEFGGPAAGTFVVAPGACGSCSDAPDITLSVADLSAAYLGGTPLRPALLAGRVTEHAPGAVARFDRMFLTDEPPWCNTDF